ncbi:MAG: hypothetical protein HY002_01745 [Candidatus Rokubacteria bacterium]|nr:hypothetical protein [Candidatus Rokubacteria bacterium]
MRILIMALVIIACAFVPVVSAQTAGSSLPTASGGEVKAKAPKAKSAHRIAKKRVARHVVRKARGAKAVRKGKASPRGTPAKQAVEGALPSARVI